MPTTLLPVGFAEFGKKYGPLTFIRVPGSTILVVNSYEAASDLLDKRGSLYADRPRMAMLGELVGTLVLAYLAFLSPLTLGLQVWKWALS